MNTETRTRHYRRGHRCHHRRHGETLEGREFGAQAGRPGRYAHKAFARMERSHRHRRSADLGGPPIIQEMRMQIHELERRVCRLQRQARHRAMREETGIERHPRRRREADFIPSHRHLERRMHAEGRRMGRMMRRAWLEHEDRHRDM